MSDAIPETLRRMMEHPEAWTRVLIRSGAAEIKVTAPNAWNPMWTVNVRRETERDGDVAYVAICTRQVPCISEPVRDRCIVAVPVGESVLSFSVPIAGCEISTDCEGVGR